MKKFTLILLSFFFLSTLVVANDFKPAHNKAKEIIPFAETKTKVVSNMRIDQNTGAVLAIYSPNYQVDAADPERMARQYMEENADLLHYSNKTDIAFHQIEETPGGYRVQFLQKYNDLPVYGSSIRISLNRNQEVVFVMNNYIEIGQVESNIVVGESAAIDIAKTHLAYNGPTVHESAETIIYNIDKATSVAAQLVKLVPAEDIFGDWEIIVNAATGEILRAEDKACYYHPDGIDGTGYVFDPDPITNAKTVYGSNGFKDFSDEPSDSLTAQLKEVVLRDISLIGSTNYKLEGPYARIVDFEQPYTGLHMQETPDFLYNRDSETFEAVNIYYHIDHSMRYINDELGFDVWPFQYDGGVKFDPHGFNNAVNAHYVGSTGHVAFGSPENAVDLGEDNAVIIHELGHGLHHWITNGGLSQVDGLSEGTSDYWAQSYTRSLGKFEPEDDGYNWFGVWGGMPSFGGPSLRVTNFDGHYPEALNGSVHHDGQMWSSSIMSIYDLIGKEACDMIFWEAMSMTSGNSSQVDAANAYIQADNDLYDGEHLQQIIPVFVDRGYIEDVVTVLFQADNASGVGPLEVNFTDQSVSYLDPLVSWEWDFNDDGIIDSYEQNPTHTYDESGFYTVRLTVSDGNGNYDLTKTDFISVNAGFYVFEAENNKRDYSGAYIRDFLEAQGYEVMYSSSIPVSFEGFDAVFLTMGNPLSGNTTLDNSLAQTIKDYLETGGNVYLEGADAFGNDQAGNSQLLNLFGLQYATDGEKNSIQDLAGHEDAITSDMQFNATNQTVVNSIDIYIPNQSAGSEAAFTESEYGIVGVQNSGEEYGQKTFCFSYALAELEDANPKSSRYNFLVSLMEFFGFPLADGYVVANFAADMQEGEPDLEVQFSDWSLSDDGFEINNWAWDFDGDGNIDSYDQNPVWTYSEGGAYNVKLIVSNGQDESELLKKDFIITRSGIFIYEQKAGEPGYSGSFIRDYLQDNYYDEVAYSNRFPNDLTGFNSIFISLGNAENKRTPLTEDMRDVIYAFGQSGGNIYLEGSDALGFDLVDDYPFWVLLGLSNVDDGEYKAVDDLQGQDETITQGMHFSGSTQPYLKSIDTYETFAGLDGAKVALNESDYGTVAVQFDGAQLFGQRTFCFSYALAGLQDGEGINTRNELLKRILDFFEVTVGVEESDIAKTNPLKVFPNPARNQITMQFDLIENCEVQIDLYDYSGKLISSEAISRSKGFHQISRDVSNLTNGIYYYRLRSTNQTETIKWVKMD